MNKTQKNPALAITTAEDVAAYLKDNPDFFSNYPELLTEIAVPHRSGGAVSLVERQIKALREQNEQTRKRLHELVEIARQNEELAHRMHHLVLTLIDAGDPGAVFKTLYDNLKRNFSADRAVVRLFADPAAGAVAGEEFVGRGAEAEALFKPLIDKRLPVSGPLEARQQAFLFGEQAADVASAVLVPLRGSHWGGVMAIGSRNPDRFQEGMGVELLANMGEALSFILKSWVAE